MEAVIAPGLNAVTTATVAQAFAATLDFIPVTTVFAASLYFLSW